MRSSAVLLTLGLAALLGVVGLAHGSSRGFYNPPPGDTQPIWSPDSATIAYSSFNGTQSDLLDPSTGAVVKLLSGSSGVVFSPDSKRIAYASAGGLVVASSDGRHPHVIFSTGAPDEWLPTGRILFSTVESNVTKWASIDPDGSGIVRYPAGVDDAGLPSSDGRHFLSFFPPNGANSVRVVGADGKALATFGLGTALGDGLWPMWSPDGTRLLYVLHAKGRFDLHVVAPDGSRNRVVGTSRLRYVGTPLWSPDSSRIAYTTADTFRSAQVVVVGITGGVRRYSTRSSSLLAWSPTGRALLYASGSPGVASLAADPARLEARLIALDLTTGTKHALGFGPQGGVSYSPDGRSIAMSAGGECRDLVGIYVMRSDGTDRRRLTRDCRVYGTAGDDVLDPKWTCCDSNPPYIVLGLAGNDTLYAGGGNPYDGSTLMGGPGNDTLYGSIRGDLLNGGTGDDTIYGGLGWDVIIGGPGHDHIYAERGADVIYARDGERDWIDCGRPGDGKNHPDVVYADRIDVVDSDCEIVHRS